jgi:hypothetical protein
LLDPFLELDQALAYVTEVFGDLGPPAPRAPRASNITVLTFDSETPTASIVAALTKARADEIPTRQRRAKGSATNRVNSENSSKNSRQRRI